MKPATTALINYLNTNDDVNVADLYTFSLVGGQVLRLVDYNLPQVVIPSANFPGSPLNFSSSGNRTFIQTTRFNRSKVTTKIGIEPAELEIGILAAGVATAESVDLVGTLSWQQYALAGGFDGATVELDRFFMPIGGDGLSGPFVTSLGAIVWFYGRVADVSIERSVLKIKVKTMINLLQQQQMPRRLFQTGCTHIYGDVMCGYDRINGKNALGVSTGIGATTATSEFGSSQSAIMVGVTPADFYIQGTCIGTNGQNNGISRGILKITSGLISLSRPFPYPISNGDTFQLLPGCDHTSNGPNGCGVMQNILRYGGFDYVPPPEFAL